MKETTEWALHETMNRRLKIQKLLQNDTITKMSSGQFDQVMKISFVISIWTKLILDLQDNHFHWKLLVYKYWKYAKNTESMQTIWHWDKEIWSYKGLRHFVRWFWIFDTFWRILEDNIFPNGYQNLLLSYIVFTAISWCGKINWYAITWFRELDLERLIDRQLLFREIVIMVNEWL
jgi:hypothetical protein